MLRLRCWDVNFRLNYTIRRKIGLGMKLVEFCVRQKAKPRRIERIVKEMDGVVVQRGPLPGGAEALRRKKRNIEPTGEAIGAERLGVGHADPQALRTNRPTHHPVVIEPDIIPAQVERIAIEQKTSRDQVQKGDTWDDILRCFIDGVLRLGVVGVDAQGQRFRPEPDSAQSE